jgi:hypothetical protein
MRTIPILGVYTSVTPCWLYPQILGKQSGLLVQSIRDKEKSFVSDPVGHYSVYFSAENDRKILSLLKNVDLKLKLFNYWFIYTSDFRKQFRIKLVHF